jgi:hypothetical protein
MKTEQIMALADEYANYSGHAVAPVARAMMQAAITELVQELATAQEGERAQADMRTQDAVLIDKLAAENKALRDALEQALPYMEAESVINGYGYYRPENPHNFHPDHEMCSEGEIANHKAACAAYDAGNYCDDYDDGWLSPNLHVTKALWGIGSYSDPIPEIEARCKHARAVLKGEPK